MPALSPVMAIECEVTIPRSTAVHCQVPSTTPTPTWEVEARSVVQVTVTPVAEGVAWMAEMAGGASSRNATLASAMVAPESMSAAMAPSG